MKVISRKPGLSIVLFKSISRTTLDGNVPVSSKFAGASNAIDLVKYMGERNSVRVSKSVRDAAGSFSFTLTDQLYYEEDGTFYGDSLYGLIEPMDYVEICMTGDAYAQSTDNIPIMMRGFISNVRISETMGADGHPQRDIFVTGHDFGKILQQMQIFHMPGIPESDADYMTAFPFFAQFGLGNNIVPASDFITDIINKVVNPYIQNMGGSGGYGSSDGDSLPTLQTDIIVNSGQVSPYGSGGWQGGTIYSLIQSVGDIGAWNEFFIEDREDAPYVVYRPNPFIDVADLNGGVQGSGNVTPIFDFPDGKFPAINPISRADVVNITAERSDANVANYYWVAAPRFDLNYESTLKAMAVQAATNNSSESPYITDYPNVDPHLYGVKKMECQTDQGAYGETNNGNGTPLNNERLGNKADLFGWVVQKRIDLFAQNKDNVIFENGSMKLKGNEKIRAGTYVEYDAGNTSALYYAVSVEHDYAPFGNYFTSVQFERGTGFINRISQKADSTSPYLAEMAGN